MATPTKTPVEILRFAEGKKSCSPEKFSEKRLKMPWVKVQAHRICPTRQLASFLVQLDGAGYGNTPAAEPPPCQPGNCFGYRQKRLCRNTAAGLASGIADWSNHGFAAGPILPKEKPSSRMAFLCGAGYGNRTRLCGLGSDRSTDELTLHYLPRYHTIRGQKMQPFFVEGRRLAKKLPQTRGSVIE